MAADLSELDLVVIMIDGVHFAQHLCVVALGIAIDGTKHPLALVEGDTENATVVKRLLVGLRDRGLDVTKPTLFVTDGAKALPPAIKAVFDHPVLARCEEHRLANIRSKLPDDGAAEVMAHIYAVRDAPTLDAARAAADRFENTYAKAFPAAVACFRDDRDALLAIHRVPVRHRIRVRTTNLAERGFEEERRRTKVIPGLMSEQATMKLAFATMIRAAERWCRVSVNDIERHQLKLLRAELGLDPPPADKPTTRRARKTEVVAA